MGHTKSWLGAILALVSMTACTVGDANLPEETEGEDFGNPNGGLTPDAGTDTPDAGEADAPSDEPQPEPQPEPEPQPQPEPPPAPTPTPPTDPSAAPVYPTARPRIYLGANKQRLQMAMTLNTAAAARYKSKLDQWLGGSSVYGLNMWNAALLSQLTGNAAYCTKAVATIETQVVAAETLFNAGQRPEVALNSYLYIGEKIGDLALVYDWCFDSTTPAQRTRWIAYANQAVSNVWDPTGAVWGTTPQPWNGWSVNNPSNNYYYSFLRATMLVGLATRGENPQADGFLTKFRDQKIMAQLLPTFATELPGGGSREGTGYGVAMRNLFELYDWWKASTGETLASKTPHTRASLLVFMHQVMPTLNKIAPTGDHARDKTAPFFDYHRHYLQLLISLYPNDPLSGRAKQMIASSNVPVMSQPFMYAYDFLYDNSGVNAAPLAGLNTTHYASGIGQIYARSGWDTNATWVNLTAGPYTESHAHQDQGSLLIYKGGWLAYDANIDSKSGIMQDTNNHSLVRITTGTTPVKQIGTTTSRVHALATGPGWTYAATDLLPAYKGNTAVQKVQREMVYLAPDVVVVYDRVQSTTATTQTWQLAAPTQPAISGNTATITNAGHQLKITRLAPSTGTMSTYSFASTADYTGGFRLDEATPGGDQRYLHVMAIDNAATTIATAGGPTNPGTTILLSNGKTATVTFNRDTFGGTLTIDGVTTQLAAGVAALAE